MRVKAFGLDQSCAVEAESALVSLLGGLRQNALAGSGGSGKNPDLTVGENTIHVKEDELDFLRALPRHAADSSTARIDHAYR
jgi:hypothetical protein